MLLRLQTTSESIGENTLDVVTLLLLAGFVFSMLTLAVLLRRRDKEPPDEMLADGSTAPAPSPPHPAVPEVRSSAQMGAARESIAPAWLAGVTIASPAGGQLSEASAVIERLLAARRERNWPAALASFSPDYLARLVEDMGVTVDDLGRVLSEAQVDGEPAALRSIELVSASGYSLIVRAGYADRTAELYHFVRIAEFWAIDAIDRA